MLTDTLNNRLANKCILFVSPVKYDGLQQRHQGIASEFAKRGCKVFYINPLSAGGFGLRVEENAGIKVITVKIPFKASNSPWLQKYAVLLAIKLIIKKLHLNIKNTILWLAEPSCAVMSNLDWQEVIYDCCDLHGAFPGQKASVWLGYENIIAGRADRIFVSHPFLKQRFNSVTRKCFLLPNATSYETKKQVHKIDLKGKIRLLSSGAHFEWVNIDWLKMLAGLDNVELHVAGTGRGKDYEELTKMKNVVSHGKLNQSELQLLMCNCHVGLVPFKEIELIEAVDPIKVYDYAACGLHIWAPDIKSLYENQYISCFIVDRLQAEKAIEEVRTWCSKVVVSVPTWADRVNSI